MKRLTIKNRAHEASLFKRRLWVIVLIMLFLIFAIIVRLIYLQIGKHQYYTTLSRKNEIALKPIPPRRGLIFSRNGVLLAQNQAVFSLMVTPSKVDNLSQELTAIQKILKISPQNLVDFYKEKGQKRRFDAVTLKEDLSETDVAIFAVNRYQFPGFSVQARLMRYYPLNQMTVDTVGYVGRINSREQAAIDNSNYAATSYIGKRGIEKYFESQLHGNVGYKEIEADSGGATVRTLGQVPAKAGVNLYLTIDTPLQATANAALKGLRGAVVAIQPATGQILALASEPNYQPNLFVTGISSKIYNGLQSNPDHPLYNRTVSGLYAMGSTIKPFIALEGLNSGTITADSKIFDPGWFRLPKTKHIYHNWNRGGFGWVNLHRAIVLSDDTYFYHLATLLGINRIDSILHQFGFGTKTNVEIPSELAGTVPSPDYKMKLTGHKWYTGDTVITGIGQGYSLATPLQLAMATATLANHGKRFQAQLLKAYQIPGNKIVPIKAKALTPIVLKNPNYWNMVIDAMQGVVRSAHGTGYRFGKNIAYSVAAKTGTAQVFTLKDDKNSDQLLPERERDNSLFIAFAPVKNPQIAVVVVVENNPSAPVVARKIIDYYLLKQQHWQKPGKPHANT